MPVFFQSCIKNNPAFDLNKLEKPTWNPTLAVPLVYSSLTIQNLLLKNNNGLIVVDDSNFCTLIYKSTLVSLKADSLIKLPNQAFPRYAAGLTAAEINTLSSTGSVNAAYTQTVNFNSGTNNPLIDSLTLNSGTLNIILNSAFQCNGKITVTIPSAKQNGVPFSQILPFTYTGVPIVINANYNLGGYDIDMTLGGTTSNQFKVNYSVSLTSAGATPVTTDSMSITGSFSNLLFNKIFGDVGQLTLFPPANKDTIAITIFQNSIGSGSFTLANPSLKMKFSNSYGVPIGASLPLLEGFTPPGSSYQLTGVPNPLPIASPNFAQIGQVLTDSFTLNKSNSNIVTVVNNNPKNFIYTAIGTSNPAGPTHKNFIIDTSVCKVYLEADLPLYGTANNFVLMDTVAFSPGSFVTNNIQSATFRIYSSNGMPIDVNMQIYFTDSLYKKLDSLIIPNQLILKSGVLNAAGMVIAPTQNTYDALVSKARLANLKNAKYLVIKNVESTTNGGNTNVKIYSNYRVDIKIGMKVNASI